MSDDQSKTTPAPVGAAADLHRRMAAGETLHHGLAPGEDKPSWWLQPPMTKVLAKAVYSRPRVSTQRQRDVREWAARMEQTAKRLGQT